MLIIQILTDLEAGGARKNVALWMNAYINQALMATLLVKTSMLAIPCILKQTSPLINKVGVGHIGPVNSTLVDL